MLGCVKVEDEGIKFCSKTFKFLKEFDIGGTGVTATGLRELVDQGKNLENVSIMGCKRLNNSDDQILIRKQIKCQGVDDVFRFHLLPELISSDLP